MDRLKGLFPISKWLPGYSKEYFRGDLVAGLTVGVMLIPQGMAYAMLAGLPPVHGLYAATAALLIYTIFGTSRQLAIGPVALDSLLVAVAIGTFASSGTASYITLTLALTLMVGVIQMLFGMFRLGFVVNLLSKPVISGFMSAAALIIAASQLKHLLGVDIGQSKYIYEVFSALSKQWGEVNYTTAAIGVVSIAIIFIIKRVNKKIPSQLIVVILGTLVVYLLDLGSNGVSLIRDIPSGLPTLALPEISKELIKDLGIPALTIALVAILEAISVAKAMQAKHKDHIVHPNQELFALGLSNTVSSIFQGLPVTGGLSRSAVNDQAGAKTNLAGFFAALLLVLTLLVLTPLFYYLPKAVLAAIIISAVVGLIAFKEAQWLWKVDKRDLIMLLVSFTATLAFGIIEGIGIGVLLSLSMVIYRAAAPHIAVLGQLPGTRYYRNICRFPEVLQDPEILIIRFDAQLFFANLNFFTNQLSLQESKKGDQLKLIIFSAESMTTVDTSALSMLKDMITEHRKRGITIYFANVIGPVRDSFYKSGLMELLGKESLFLDVNNAVNHYKGNEEGTLPDERASQTNATKKVRV